MYSDLTLYARSMSIIDVNDEEDLRNKLIGYSESYIIRLAKDITIQDKDKKIQDSSLIIDRNVVLDLNGHNLSITQKANGIKIINNSTLRIIDSGSNVNNTLTVMVNSDSDNYAYYAGINTSQGKLIIDSGRVTVNGGPYSAAIGCELSVVYFGEIIINGGVVNAEGGKWAAAIGSGYDSGGGKVIINGGDVTAEGGENSAGIGGGYASNYSYITINGGTVNAKGGDTGAGIGSGRRYVNGIGANETIVTINGGIVTAIGINGAAGIGGSVSNKYGEVKIYGGTIFAEGAEYAQASVDIGNGQYGSGMNVYINGGSVYTKKGKVTNPKTSENESTPLYQVALTLKENESSLNY